MTPNFHVLDESITKITGNKLQKYFFNLSDPNVLKKPKRLKKAFQLAAGSLKDEKLKQKILKNFDDCFTDLQRYVCECCMYLFYFK
jgi:hypothetical protein